MDVQTDRGPSGLDEADRQPRSFYARFPGAFAYPFKGMGWAAIVAGALFFWGLNFLRCVPFVGLLIGLFVAGYLAAFMIRIIDASAAGRDSPPDWPDLSSFWDDVLRPLLLLVATVAFSFLPLVIRLLVGVWNGGPSGGGYPKDELFWICLGWGLLYLPMGLIAVALFDSVAALNPVVVVGGIVKTFPAYLLAAGLLFVCYWLNAWLQEAISDLVPVLGSLVATAVALYFLMVEMRLLGLLYNTHRHRLKWFESG